ncbi:MAG: rod shape-determining protein RodA [Clostridium sp.]|uniref:rod shape-determining protein RodA n=1 Tax=Clostridium sp. TaxID=1506 RepID=UPI003EE4B8C7
MLRRDLLFDGGTTKRNRLDFKKIRDIDKLLLISMIVLILFGILNIYLCTKGTYGKTYGEKQFIWMLISMVALYIFVSVDYRFFYNYVPIFYWASIVLLIITRFMGTVVNGARGWLRFGPISVQPSEIAKVAMIMMLAKCLEEMDLQINNFRNLVKLCIYAGIPMIFIIIQPDMGMTMVCFFIVLGIFFVAGLDKRIFIGGFAALVVVVAIVWNVGLIQDYQKARITSFLHPQANATTTGYHLSQSLISIGAGGIFGDRPSLYNDGTTGYAAQHVPEVQTDFIFAAIAEQWGFLGVVFLLTMYGILITRMINIARSAKDVFGSIICIGITAYFLFAIFQNIGMTIGLMPITGITLPLISYGGSSLLSIVVTIGLVLNIGMRRKKIRF